MPSSVQRSSHSAYRLSSSRRASRTTKSISSRSSAPTLAAGGAALPPEGAQPGFGRPGAGLDSLSTVIAIWHGRRHVLQPGAVLVAHRDLARPRRRDLVGADLAGVEAALQTH